MEKHEIACWYVTASCEPKLPTEFRESVVTTALEKITAIMNNADLRATMF